MKANNTTTTKTSITFNLPTGKGIWATAMIHEMIEIEIESRKKMVEEGNFAQGWIKGNDEFIALLHSMKAASPETDC